MIVESWSDWRNNSIHSFLWWIKTLLIYPLRRNVRVHTRNSFSWIRQMNAKDWNRGGFEHETFFILSAFYTWHRLFVTRQTLTRLNWWKRAGFICTAINFGNTCNDNAENANIYEERKNIQREREKEREEGDSVSDLNIENEMILFGWY